MKISVIIPVYQEKNTIGEIINRLNRVDLPKEIIIVDDGSTDGTREVLSKFPTSEFFKIIYHDRNKGKGSAIKTALPYLTGDIVIIQDADLEYDPSEYPKLIEPILNKETLVVYGSRNLKRNKKSYIHFFLGGILLSKIANLLYGCHLTDESTGYKVFATEVLKNIDWKAERFDFCPEITAKILRKGYQIKEVPISYYPRKFSEGKKITLKDGLTAIWTLIKYRFLAREKL